MPWGAYLALWSFGTLLPASFLPLWYANTAFGVPSTYGLASFWEMLGSLRWELKFAMNRPSLYFIQHNVWATLIPLVLGAAFGVATRLCCNAIESRDLPWPLNRMGCPASREQSHGE